MAKAKRKKTDPALIERYRPPSMADTVHSDAEMMAADIVRKHPAVKKAEARISKKIERQALSLARTGVRLPRHG